MFTLLWFILIFNPTLINCIIKLNLTDLDVVIHPEIKKSSNTFQSRNIITMQKITNENSLTNKTEETLTTTTYEFTSPKNDKKVLQKKSRKPIRLTMKQGLLMNQLLSVYSLDKIEDQLCKNHSNEFRVGLRAFEPWALKMFDSSSKLQPGIFLGNLVEFGAYDQCIGIYYESDYGPIWGKHCTMKITPTIETIKEILRFRNISEKKFEKMRIQVDKSALFWSVCLPHSCNAEDTKNHFTKHIEELGHGLNLTVDLDEEHCLTIHDQPVLQFKDYLILGLLGSFPVLSIICAIVEASNGSESNNRIINIFSATTNWKKVITIKENSDLDCIHGIRFLTACYVIIGHRFLSAIFFPLTNALDTLDWTMKYTSTFIIGGTICVDTFFMLSGLLVSMSFFGYVEKFNKFNLFFFYTYRYLRLTPPLAVVILIHATLIQHLGSGPIWNDSRKSIQLPCQYFWWSSLLYIQSYINPNAFCILQTWYLSCDMIYYYLSPLILYPLWKAPKIGIINIIVIYILSVATSFYLAWINRYEGSFPITGQLFDQKYFQHHYVAPQARAPTFIIGLGFGYIIHKTRNKPIKINYFFNLFMWVISLAAMLAGVMGCHSFLEASHPYNRLESSSFLAFSRSGWTFGICWVIWSCIHGYGGIVNYFLSLDVFIILARISYGMFLLHILVQFLKRGATKHATHFSDFISIYNGLADILFMIFVGFLFKIFYELPLAGLLIPSIKSGKRNSKVDVEKKDKILN